MRFIWKILAWLNPISLERQIYVRWRKAHAWEDIPQWGDDDARALKTYFQSDSGRKVRSYLLSTSIHESSKVVLTPEDLEFRCGYAAGFKGALATLDALTRETISETKDPEGVPNHLEHLSP